jgi:hypothetical protein
VQAQKKQVEIKDLRIKQVEDQNAALQKENESGRSVLRNPFLYLVLGFAVGLYAARK